MSEGFSSDVALGKAASQSKIASNFGYFCTSDLALFKLRCLRRFSLFTSKVMTHIVSGSTTMIKRNTNDPFM